MATQVKKKAAPKKAKAPAKKEIAKKTSAEKKVETPENLDRKSLAQKARQLKTELLAVRFNIQAPSLKDYRQKRKELASVLSQLK